MSSAKPIMIGARTSRKSTRSKTHSLNHSCRLGLRAEAPKRLVPREADRSGDHHRSGIRLLRLGLRLAISRPLHHHFILYAQFVLRHCRFAFAHSVLERTG